jgi:hypothetical protein
VTPQQFLATIYLGDRACTGVTIDAVHKRVCLHVDLISRVRDPSGQWNYYPDEDIIDGTIVFSGASWVSFDPTGPIPNDFIDEITASAVDAPGNGGKHSFEIWVGSVDEQRGPTMVKISIRADDIHLEDPRKPGERIRS